MASRDDASGGGGRRGQGIDGPRLRCSSGPAAQTSSKPSGEQDPWASGSPRTESTLLWGLSVVGRGPITADGSTV